MSWTQVSYVYDGSFAGFLTCVFDSYAGREEPMSFSTPEDGRLTLRPVPSVVMIPLLMMSSCPIDVSGLHL